MKRRKVITLFLLFVSIMVLTIEVIPHHHHNGTPCLLVLETEQTDQEHGNCNKCSCDCLTSFYAADLSGHSHHESYCNHFPSIILFADLVSFYLNQPEESVPIISPVFIESLHATQVTCAVGLRAPPVFA